jgi:hypothetical protein
LIIKNHFFSCLPKGAEATNAKELPKLYNVVVDVGFLSVLFVK